MNQLNKEKTSYLKYILNIRRSKFAYILLFCATFAKIIWTLRDIFPQLSLLNIDINLLITQSINSLDPTKLKIINISSIFWSLLIISIFELTKSGNMKTLSLSRVKFSEGGKYEGDTPEQRTIHRVAAQEQLARYREMEHGLYD